jgi:hypothetical protein
MTPDQADALSDEMFAAMLRLMLVEAAEVRRQAAAARR